MELIRELIRVYLEDVSAGLAALREVLAGHQWDQARRAAHSLHSSSGNFGAHVVVDLACKAEEAAGRAASADSESLIGQIVGERTGTDFSHGICPECYKRVVEPQLKALARLTDPEAEVRP